MNFNRNSLYFFKGFAIAGSILGLLLFVGMPNDTHALTPPQDSVNVPESAESVFSAHADIIQVPDSGYSKPTVVEVPLPDTQSSQPAVFDTAKQEFIPSYTYIDKSENVTTVSIQAETAQRSYDNLSVLQDDNQNTSQDFALPDTSNGKVTFELTAEESITTDQLAISLRPHVALPDTVSVRSGEGGQIVVAKRPLEDTRIRFPQIQARKFNVTFTYAQPLRIAELELLQNNPNITAEKSVRFLTQPGHSYLIPYNPDRQVRVPIEGETPNLRDDEGVKQIASSSVTYRKNPDYIRADVDGDGVVDVYDNCVRVSNPEQIDENNNGRGDACDDFDKDNVINKKDNCPDTPNRNQADVDDDGVGDVCDDREDRITERYEWVPWVGILLAGLVLITLLGYTLYEMRDEFFD